MIASNYGKKEIYKITTPELPLGNGLAGTGDMTSAVFLSRFMETGSLEKTLELCTSSIFGILEESLKNTSKKGNEPLELMIIDAQEQLVAPSNSFKAEKLKTWQ